MATSGRAGIRIPNKWTRVHLSPMAIESFVQTLELLHPDGVLTAARAPAAVAEREERTLTARVAA